LVDRTRGHGIEAPCFTADCERRNQKNAHRRKNNE